VKVKYGSALHTGLSFAIVIAQIGNQYKGVRMKIMGILKRRYGNNKRVGNCHILVIY
jgi:hypothetical protein